MSSIAENGQEKRPEKKYGRSWIYVQRKMSYTRHTDLYSRSMSVTDADCSVDMGCILMSTQANNWKDRACYFDDDREIPLTYRTRRHLFVSIHQRQEKESRICNNANNSR